MLGNCGYAHTVQSSSMLHCWIHPRRWYFVHTEAHTVEVHPQHVLRTLFRWWRHLKLTGCKTANAWSRGTDRTVGWKTVTHREHNWEPQSFHLHELQLYMSPTERFLYILISTGRCNKRGLRESRSEFDLSAARPSATKQSRSCNDAFNNISVIITISTVPRIGAQGIRNKRRQQQWKQN